MAKVRVYQPPGNVPAIVVWPYDGLRRAGESDDGFLARMMVRYESKHPEVVGRPSADVDPATLPPPSREVRGQRFNVRRGWRVVAGAVIVDESKVVPVNVPVNIP